MNTQARDILSAARVRAVGKHPYLATALFSLRPLEMVGLGTMAVNAEWQLAYDADKVLEWGSIGTAAILVHEVQHLLREHPERFEDWLHGTTAKSRLAAAGVAAMSLTSQLQQMFNIAGDCEINDDIEASGWRLPSTETEKPVRAAMLGMPDRLTAEEYIEHMLEEKETENDKKPEPEPQPSPSPSNESGDQPPPPSPPKGTPGCGGSCGCCDGGAQDWEKDIPANAPEGMSKDEASLVMMQTAQEVADHVRTNGRGSVPLGLQVWAEKLIAPPKVDWRRRLRALVRNAVSMASGADDYTYQKRSRREAVMRQAMGRRAPMLPAMNRPVPNVKLVLDTSGSMSGLLEAALSEVLGVVRAVGSPCEVVAVDAAVHAVQFVAKVSDLNKVTIGGGGTDMRVGIDRAAKGGKADVIVVVTDGYTPWPTLAEMPRRARLVAAVIGTAEVPEHIGNVVRIDHE